MESTAILSLKDYIKKQFNALDECIDNGNYTTNNLPPNFPISRGTYFNWKKGRSIRTCTIYKVCAFLGWPEPRIIF